MGCWPMWGAGVAYGEVRPFLLAEVATRCPVGPEQCVYLRLPGCVLTTLSAVVFCPLALLEKRDCVSLNSLSPGPHPVGHKEGVGEGLCSDWSWAHSLSPLFVTGLGPRPGVRVRQK